MNISIFEKYMNNFKLQRPLKIALATVSLSGGGAERVAAILSNYFVSKGIEVHHLVFAGTIEYEYSGKLVHFGSLNTSKNSLLSRLKRFKLLYSYCKKEKFDFIIDFRTKEHYLQEVILNNFVYNDLIQTIHNYHLDYYFNKNKFLSKLLYFKCLKFVSVAKSIQTKVANDFKYNNLQVILNPIENSKINHSLKDKIDLDFNYIVAAGRLHESNVKQMDVIIELYSKSILPSKNIKLVILGNGDLMPNLKTLVENLNLQNVVIFKGHVSNPFVYFKQAKFLIMASKFEGFPMVIVESLYCNLPVISWDFNSGPNEIIETGINGILVENKNQIKLIEAMNKMVTDINFYNECKIGARKSVEKFYINVIGEEWLQLFEKLQGKGA